MKKWVILLVSVLFAFACLGAASAADVADALVGVWKSPDLDMEMHLNADGTGYTVMNGTKGTVMAFEYRDSIMVASVVEDDGSRTEEIIEYSLDGNHLIILQDTIVRYESDGTEISRDSAEIGLMFHRMADVNPLLGVWYNEENDIELQLNEDGTAVSVLQGKANSPVQFECGDQQFTVTDISGSGYKTVEVFNYIIDGDTMTISTEEYISYDPDGIETDRKEMEVNLTFVRKTDAPADDCSLIGVWSNDDGSIQLFLNANGTFYSVLDSQAGPIQTLEYDDSRFIITLIEDGVIKTAEIFDYTLVGDTLQVTGGTAIYYDENGNETDREDEEVNFTLYRQNN